MDGSKWLVLAAVAVVAGVALWAWSPPAGSEGMAKGITCPTDPGLGREKGLAMDTATRKLEEGADRNPPPIEAQRPAKTELATFALG